MNAFAKFGLKNLSPSQLNCWRESPGLWALRYLGKLRDDAGPAAWRGNAVEKGLLTFFQKKNWEDALAMALSVFDGECMGEFSDRINDERANIAPMLGVAIKESEWFPSPVLGAQTRVEHWMPGIEVPVIGYADFLLEDGTIVDLKTSTRMPNNDQPKPDHARQAALYSIARQAPSHLMYVTAKKSKTYEIKKEERDLLIEEMRRDALSLQTFLSNQNDAVTAIKSLPMATDNFRWSEAASIKLKEFV